VSHVDDRGEVRSRGVGRPSKAAPYREQVEKILASEPQLMSLEILRRVRECGYEGGKSAMYRLIAELRPRDTDVQMRFEGLPGEFSQHDFGEVNVRFVDGTTRKIRFFASRLKWSRWVEVDVVPDQRVETLVRTVADHFEAFGGVPLCAVFDRPKTVALEWRKDGVITKWNPVFAQAAFEIGFAAEVCWPYQARQKGSVENLVKWVKGSFFKQRRFRDMDDLLSQLEEWKEEVNLRIPSRATGEIPAERRQQELARLRPSRVAPDDLALRFPVFVGPTAEVVHETHSYSMPPEAAGISGPLYLYRPIWRPSLASAANAISNGSRSSRSARPQFASSPSWSTTSPPDGPATSIDCTLCSRLTVRSRSNAPSGRRWRRTPPPWTSWPAASVRTCCPSTARGKRRSDDAARPRHRP
jgi:transposase